MKRFLWLMLLLSSLAMGQTENLLSENFKMLSLENDFLKVIVNNQAEDKGRFSIETTLGDPQNLADNNQPLIYGRPIPWTSYTSLSINGEAWVFGGPNRKLQMRGGKAQRVGEVTFQGLRNEGLVTVSEFAGPSVNVTQTLSFIRNPSTQVKDLALIRYDIHNQSSQTQNIGLRMMLDTKLGQNDGAPFRIGAQAISSETELKGKALVDYWQAFDSLASPNVIAQGNLSLAEHHLNKPSRMYLANWGTLADHPWDFTYKPDRSFIREGEFEKDTALAMYWDPSAIGPGKTKTIKTSYGLGGVTLKAGQLSLGLTAPAQAYAASKKAILVVAYVLNTGGYDSKNTIINFNFPPWIQIQGGKSSYALGTVKPGETKQVPIRITLNNAPAGNSVLNVTVHSDTLPKNEASRNLFLRAPPEIQLAMIKKPSKEDPYNSYYDVDFFVTNKSNKEINKLAVSLDIDDKLRFPDYETKHKQAAKLLPNQQLHFNWQVRAIEKQREPFSLKATAVSEDTNPKAFKSSLSPLSFDPSASLALSKANITAGDYFFVWVLASHVNPNIPHDFTLAFDPNQVQPIRWSPEPFMIQSKQTQQAALSDEAFFISDIIIPAKHPDVRVCKVHFKALQSGAATMTLTQNDALLHRLQVSIEEGQTP